MTDRNPMVVVTSDDTLPAIVDRIREAGRGGHVVHLVVPIDSSLLLTASEFRRLKDAIDEQRLAVLMQSADPLRLRLAERLGVLAQPLPRPRPALTTTAVAAPRLPALLDLSHLPSRREEAEPVVEEPVIVPAPARDPDSLWPDQNGHANEVVDEPVEPRHEENRPGNENPPRRWFPVAAALVLIVVGAVLAMRFILPQAVVTIVPRSAPVAASVLFDITTDGKPIDDGASFSLQPQSRILDVVWTGSAPVTGVRVEPDGTAAGPIELRNPSSDPAIVEAGTIVTTETDIAFVFTDEVTVPGADETGEPGAATGRVRAVAPGTGGNVGTGEIGGRLPNGVYYSNRMESTAGGTDKEFPVVAQADLDALAAAAHDAAPALAADALAHAENGQAIVPSSVKVTARHDAFDHQPGEDAESVSVKTTLTLQALTYDAAAASAHYGPALAMSLSSQAPGGFAVEQDDIVYEEPVAVSESDRGVRLEIAARADAVAILDDAERNALASALAGASPEKAAVILAQSPDIAESTVVYHPGWLSAQMPNNASRIQFEIAQ
jgi:hypothetical protein